MLSQRWFYSSVIIVLIILNGIQGLLLLKQLKEKKQEDLTEIATSLRAMMKVEDLRAVLTDLQMSCKESSDVNVLVSPYPCQACVSSQNAIIYDVGRKYPGKQIRMIVSHETERDYLAYFSELPNITIVTYNTPGEAEEENMWVVYDAGYIFFTEKAGRIEDYYLMDKNYPGMSEKFLARILE